MSKHKSFLHTLKIIVPILALLLATLACSFSDGDSQGDQEATAFALETTATVLSLQSTQAALEAQQQAASQPTQAPPVQQQPTQAPPPTQAPVVNDPVYTADFYINNDSDFTICYFYLSPVEASDWGVDQLEDATVFPGETFTINDVPYGTYDMSARDCDDSVLHEEYNVEFPLYDQFNLFNSVDEPLCGNGVCGDFENPGNCPEDCGYVTNDNQIPLTIVNQTSEPVCYVWIGPPYSEWIGDVLGDQTIPGWGSTTVYVNPGEWALMAEDCSGTEYSRMKLTESLSIYSATTWYVDP